MQKYLILLRNENPKWCYGEPYHKWGAFCTDRSGAETFKLQRYRKHKEEWLIWLLFQSFARKQSEDASSLLVSIWARPRTLYLWCKVAQRCGSGVNSNAYIAVGKQRCNGKYTNEYIFLMGWTEALVSGYLWYGCFWWGITSVYREILRGIVESNLCHTGWYITREWNWQDIVCKD